MCVLPKYVEKLHYIDSLGEFHFKLKFYNNKELWLNSKNSSNNFKNFFTLPCGFCPECCKSYSDEWATRIINESSLYKHNCCLTLTYNSKFNDGFIHKRDLQLFFKKLRKKIGKFRYFACGEYGSKRKRPHYHIIIFGWKPDDMVFLKKSSRGNILYNSDLVFKTWNKGFISVSYLDEKTARYTAKYMQKLNEDDLHKSWLTMSLKPGIGLNWFYKNLFNDVDSVNNDKIYLSNSIKKIPRYYLRKFESSGRSLDSLRSSRELKASLNYSDEKINQRLADYRSNFDFLKKKY